ncbi:unnamed protein product [Lactuca saligna]|uniref:Uncharacterized protein n=1 Tax=Lactuca saligna TaxID=75948 RepID=A0AA35YNE7_LACSI|nr:unnamed protein product [Lactuca saligna]
MAKHISKKIKKRKLVLQKVSSEEEEVPKTLESILSMKKSTPKQTPVIPPEVSLTKSSDEEVRTSGIITHVSDKDVNVTMGEGDLNKEPPVTTQGIIETSTINTLVSLPPFIIYIISISSSLTFGHIIIQPITSLFSSQSTVPPKSINDTDTDDGEFGGTFASIEFDPEEEDIPRSYVNVREAIHDSKQKA